MIYLREVFFFIGFSMVFGWGIVCLANVNVMNTVVGLRYLVDSLRKVFILLGFIFSLNAIFIS